MFQIDDYVIYASFGICKIVDIIKQDFAGADEKEYYVVKSMHSENLTVYLPTANDDYTNKLRRILTQNEISELFRDVADDESEWIEDNRFRSQAIKKTIVQGSPLDIFKLIKTVRKQKEKLSAIGKKINIEDEKAMNTAEQLLYDEFGFVLNLDAEQVLAFVEESKEIYCQ